MIFLEVVEHSCAAGTLLQGESLQNISKDMDIVSYKLPLGVTGGICPFNFPAMIPLWMFPLSLIAGNTMIIKPSERDPGATMLLMELLNEVGCPPGVVNVSTHSNFSCTFGCRKSGKIYTFYKHEQVLNARNACNKELSKFS